MIYIDELQMAQMVCLTAKVLQATGRPTTSDKARALGYALTHDFSCAEQLEIACLAAEIEELADEPRNAGEVRLRLDIKSLISFCGYRVAKVAALRAGFWDRTPTGMKEHWCDYGDVAENARDVPVVSARGLKWTGRELVTIEGETA